MAPPQFFGRDDALVAIHKVYATEDDNQDDDVKMFITIDLQMEIDDGEFEKSPYASAACRLRGRK